jgi:hypothetical protein
MASENQQRIEESRVHDEVRARCTAQRIARLRPKKRDDARLDNFEPSSLASGDHDAMDIHPAGRNLGIP